MIFNHSHGAKRPPKRMKSAYLVFLPPIFSGLPRLEFAVARTLGFSCFGFLASRLPWCFCLVMLISDHVPHADIAQGSRIVRRSGLPVWPGR